MARRTSSRSAAPARSTRSQTIEQANEVKAQLEGVKVRLAVRSGDAGRLFGSVTPADIASAIKAAGGPEVDKRRIELGSPIKTLGAHQVSVRLHPEVAAKLDIEVVAAVSAALGMSSYEGPHSAGVRPFCCGVRRVPVAVFHVKQRGFT